MELNGRFYLDVTELVEAIMELKNKAPETTTFPGMAAFSGEGILPGDNAETKEEEPTPSKGPHGPQWNIPGELQDPPYTNVPTYESKPEFDPPGGYEWTNCIWGWYAKHKI